MNAHGHLLWMILTGTCLFWYTFITLYVAWRGLGDIRRMLGRLKDDNGEGRD